MIITIDGLSASGKSTIAKLLAQNLNFFYLNTGFIYRAFAYILLKNGADLNRLEYLNQYEIADLINPKDIHYIYEHNNTPHVFYKSEDITSNLKNKEIDKAAAKAGINPTLREIIKDLQLDIVSNYTDIVAEGRDVGTNIFPNAKYKFFFTASLPVRAKRWQQDQYIKGNSFSIEEATQLISNRDNSDTNRIFGKSIPSLDAIVVDSSNLSTSEVLDFLLNLIQL